MKFNLNIEINETDENRLITTIELILEEIKNGNSSGSNRFYENENDYGDYNWGIIKKTQ